MTTNSIVLSHQVYQLDPKEGQDEQDELSRESLVQHLCMSFGMSEELASNIVQAFFGYASIALASGDVVDLRGFGSIKANVKINRKLYNPNRKTITHTNTIGVIFRASKKIIHSLNSASSFIEEEK